MDILKDKTDEELESYFKQYVENFQCAERHTKAACDEVAKYDKLVEYFFPKEIKPQMKLYNKMMDVAVEFEESGFMAGYRLCLKHLQEQGEIPTEESTNPPPADIQRQEMENTSSIDTNDFISTKEIGKMFGTPNWKIVRRIDEFILPKVPDDERGDFIKMEDENVQNRTTTVYWMGHNACKKYVDYMMNSKKFHNVEVGIAKLIVEMQNKFQPATA
jgi:hypothetical protein